MVLVLLTRILIWAAVGLLIYWVLLKFIPRNFLTWFGGAIILALIVLSFISPDDQTIGGIWQVISLPLTPLGASVILLMISLSQGMKKVNGRYVTIALLILLLSSIPLIARTLVGQAEQSVERAYQAQQALCRDLCPAVDPVPLGLVSSIVVIGENVDAYNRPNALSRQVDSGNNLDPVLVSRLNSAAGLYNDLSARGISPFVVVTAGPRSSTSEEQQRWQQVIQQRLVNNGVPISNIVITDSGTSVRQAAEDQIDFLQERGQLSPADTPAREARRVVLVAPALTMRRAALTFEQAGLQAVAWPTDLYGSTGPADGDTLARLADLVPSVEALRLTTRYWEELLTSIYYFLRGWLPGFNVQWEQVVETIR